MQITVASGKGGTGKTTVAVNLALSLAAAGTPLTFLDCDVEEPNAHIFLRPQIEREETTGILIPEVNDDLCTYCGRCAEVCVFHAIAVIGKQVLVFPELCHGCGSCAYNCPEKAITEVLRPTAKLRWGKATCEGTPITFGEGVLDVGQAMATPVIRELKKKGLPTEREAIAILDAPPGNSCPVVETMRGSDFVLLVTEPTPFGLHDLRLAVQVAREELGLPAGVVINRDGVGDDSVERFCAEAGIPILMRIPLDRRIAEAYAQGETIVARLPEYRERFLALYRRIEEEVGR